MSKYEYENFVCIISCEEVNPETKDTHFAKEKVAGKCEKMSKKLCSLKKDGM